MKQRKAKPAYGISSLDYLSRAKNQIKIERQENFFYAAFELRAGIEARMQEYLDVHDHISKKKKKGWQVAKLGRTIEEAFQTGDKVVEIKVLEDVGKGEIGTFFFTPVKAALRKKAQRLGDFLHTQRKRSRLTDQWWKDFQILLKQTVRELENANQGMLLGPPLMRPSTGEAHMIGTRISNEELKFLSKKMAPNEKVIFQVKYHSKIPKGSKQGVKLK